jgi:type VI secretion system protein ImpA
MGTKPVIDVESLLQPISPESPAGEALTSLSPEFDALKSSFSRAKVAERKLREEIIASGTEGVGAVEAPDWGTVVDLAARLLREKSKDLRIAAWLAEGLMRQHGFAGIRDGLLIFQGLCGRYWGSLHPAPTPDEGHRDAVSQFAGLMGESSLVPLNELPITKSVAGDAYSSIDYAEASELEAVSEADIREKRLAGGAITFSQLEDAVRKTDRTFYLDLVADLNQIIALIQEIESFLNDHCVADETGESTAPSVSTFRSRVQEILDNVRRLAADHLAEPIVVEGSVVDVNGELITAGGQDSRMRMSAGIVVSRDDALEVLRKVASYFEHAEPHSPISFALRQIVSWGNMSLPDLLRELIEDDSVMRNLEKRIGLPKKEEYS